VASLDVQNCSKSVHRELLHKYMKYDAFMTVYTSLLFPSHLLFSSPIAKMTEPIIMHNGSHDVVSCKEVPFGDF